MRQKKKTWTNNFVHAFRWYWGNLMYAFASKSPRHWREHQLLLLRTFF